MGNQTVGRDPGGLRTEINPVWKRILRAVFIYALIPYLVVTIGFTVFQRRLIYQPTVANSLSIAESKLTTDFGVDAELTTADGNTLHGWLAHATTLNNADADKAPLVVYFPGNSLNRLERIADVREVASRGFDVLIFDYRGFGDSSGAPSEAALSSDAVLIWQYAHETLGYDEQRTVIFGESLGGGVAMSLWSKANAHPPQPAAVILNSTFASMPRIVAAKYPYFPFQFLLFDRWQSIDRIGSVEAPITIFHGTDDQMIPVEHGQALAQASPHARFVEIQGGVHNQIPMARLKAELESVLVRLESN